MHKIALTRLLAWMRTAIKGAKWFRREGWSQEEDIFQVTRKRLSKLHLAWQQLDKETQYQIAKECAAQVGRTEEDFIEELLQQM